MTTAATRQARYVVNKAPGIGGNPIPADEPCIVVRGQDKLALHVIDGYIAMYEATATNVDEAVVRELRLHRDAIEQWQAEHPPKFADR